MTPRCLGCSQIVNDCECHKWTGDGPTFARTAAAVEPEYDPLGQRLDPWAHEPDLDPNHEPKHPIPGMPVNVMAACGHRTTSREDGSHPLRCAMCEPKGTATPEQAARWRPQVVALADAMEAKLKANDHKGDWRRHDLDYLVKRLCDEVKELAEHPWDLSEAADCANFCMFIVDRAGGLAPKKGS